MNDRTKARLFFFFYVCFLLVFETSFTFMILNMFLALLALELSFLLPLFQIKKKKDIPLSLFFYFVFVFFSPNILYVLTDLIHMNLFSFHFKTELVWNEWFNFFVLVNGVLFSLFYYVLMIKQVLSVIPNKRYSHLVLFVFTFLSSVGVYIGRFLRFHSVDIFSNPFSVLRQFFESMQIESIYFVLGMLQFQWIIIWLCIYRKRSES